MSLTSKHDKNISNQILLLDGVTFYGILLAAINRADSENLERFEQLFPKAVHEARIRYYAPGGCVSLQEWKAHNPYHDVDEAVLEKLFAEAARKAAKR